MNRCEFYRMVQTKIGAIASFAIIAFSAYLAHAELKLPAMFTDHAVLQREMPVPVWGWAEPGEEVTVAIAGQTHKTKADDKGKWQRDAQAAVGRRAAQARCRKGKNRLEVKDILVGEVWLCSGQSNMEFALAAATNGDLEVSAANHPQIRLVERERTRQPNAGRRFRRRSGKSARRKSVGGFSAVGYFFGRELHDQLNVPIGLIDDSWGGSACEAWIRRDRMEGNPLYDGMLKKWDDTVKDWDEAKWKADLAEWRKKADAAKKAGQPAPPNRPHSDNPAVGNHRPANLYHARVEPVMPYAIRGAIWYQGESNAGASLSISRHVSAHDQVVARGLEAGRLPVLLGATGRLHGREAGAGRQRLGRAARSTNDDAGQAAEHRARP